MPITLGGVGKKYADAWALAGVNLDIDVGRPVTVLGKNGAGKSTLLRVVAGLTDPTVGTVAIPAGTRVAYLPEDRGLFGQVDVRTHLRYFAELAGVPPDRAADEWLERLGLAPLRAVRVKDLSKGNQQKVQLASCLIDEPECALLDEPFAGLDPINLILMRDVIRDYAREHYVVLSAHHVDQIDGLAEDVVFLQKGTVVAQGSTTQIAGARGGRRLVVPDTPEHRRLLDTLGQSGYLADGRTITTVGGMGWAEARALVDAFGASGADVCFRSRSLAELFVDLLDVPS